MKKLALTAALLAAGGLCLNDVSVGHGGTYRGPGDTVPPGGGGGGGGGGPTTGPQGPVSPGGQGPAGRGTGQGGPQNPGGNPAGPQMTGGDGASEDLDLWQFWWGFNREPYLNLKARIHSGEVETGSAEFFIGRGEKAQAKKSLRPSEAEIRQQIVPALLAALRNDGTKNDIATGSMIALAKIGDPKDETGESKEGFAQIISEFLTSGTQEIRETAAVALGILGNESSIEPLTHLALNSAAGRQLMSKGAAVSEVDQRTRSFALYGLGLIGYRTEDESKRREIVDTLTDMLRGDALESGQRDMSVAALTAFGLVPLQSNPEWKRPDDKKEAWKASECREAQVEWLLDYYKDDKGVNFLVRAHAPTTLARLVQFADPRALWSNDADRAFRDLKVRVAEVLIETVSRHSKAEAEIQQTAVLALGLLGDADGDKIDEEIRKALMEVEDLANNQLRNFAVMALAYVGGRPGSGDEPTKASSDIRKELLKKLASGQSHRKSWAGIALGVLERSLSDATESPTNPTSAEAVRTELSKSKSPREVGAYSIALGLMRDPDSRSVLLDKLQNIAEWDTRGYVAVGLGLLGDRQSIEPIQEIVRNSKFRADLLRSAATALGVLGDQDVVPELVTMLGEANSLSSQAAISQALGFIGDSRSITPLVDMLKNQSLTDSARGFAAVALGIVADKEELPWNAKISVNLNYRANTPTLTDPAQGTGILDIL